jgi:putative Mg2+ transporter-C (MgtC) family protein
MDTFFDQETIVIVSRLVVALLLGMVIGLERVWAHKTAGVRTYALVSMGSALFIIISEMVAFKYADITNFDPMRLASQIVVGVGFIGTGLIFTRDSKLMGLTTATGLWVSAGIGMATGFGLFKLSIIATFLTLFIFTILWFIEEKFRNTSFVKND